MKQSFRNIGMNLLVTGSGGLIGSESVRLFSEKGFKAYGIDNDMRGYFFGNEGSTRWNFEKLQSDVPGYTHYDVDVRNRDAVEAIFKQKKFDLIIHAAGQPSHNWSAKDPLTDFGINATGTLIMLENMRKYCPDAVFIFTSSSKVYGDMPNKLQLVEYETRFDLEKEDRFYEGIDETVPFDQKGHTIYGVSKLAADALVKEFGEYYGLRTVCFRPNCMTGPAHSSSSMHGFLSYLTKTIVSGNKYFINGYKGKQVRDNIHAHDLVNAFYHFSQNPRSGEIYNIGGSRHSNVSILEAIKLIEDISGKKADIEYKHENQKADHIWYISDIRKFRSHYPEWDFEFTIEDIISDIIRSSKER